MDIEIIEHTEEALRVVIRCDRATDEVMRLKYHIELFDQKIRVKKGHEWSFISLLDVLYFESVDNRTFLYTEGDVSEVRQRLYELENVLSDKDFIRISKSQIVNINKIRSLKPEMNRTILATMCNGEQLYISRKYVPVIRNLLSI